HSIECDSETAYATDHPMWDLLREGIIIAPMVQFDARDFASPQDAADGLIQHALACKAAFYSVPSHSDLPFYWSVRWAAFGGATDGVCTTIGPGHLPSFTHHAKDCPDADYPGVSHKANGYFNGKRVRFLQGGISGATATIQSWTRDSQIITLSTALPG